MENIVETSNLTKIYDKNFTAVDNLNLEIQNGEIFGLLGPNGAGKTTTIRMLTTLTKPTSGTAFVVGHDIAKEPNRVREAIGYSTQESAVDESATAREYLSIFGHYYHLDLKRINTRIDELLELFDLTDAAGRLVKTYSGGMRKRLEIATALIHEPKLLFLDEPTLGLDIQTRVHMWQYIQKLNQNGTTILLTTHYLEEADRLCDRIAIVDHGKIAALDTPKGLKSKIKGQVVSVIVRSLEKEELNATINKAKQALSSQSFITGIQLTGDGVNVHVDDGISAISRIQILLDKVGIAIESTTLSNPSLDDVFIMLTGRTIREEKGKPLGLHKMGEAKRRQQ